MTAAAKGWREIKAEVARRIQDRRWPPGSVIPAETELAIEFGCARATVNRAMRELADAGILVRKRRAGTRVAEHPVRQARLDIPVIRLEVEAAGGRYTHRLLLRAVRRPPARVRALFGGSTSSTALRLDALHLADDRPYAVESRWVNTDTVPKALDTDFDRVSANEWLVQNTPFAGGQYRVSAQLAGVDVAEVLGCAAGDPVLLVERHTLDTAGRGITEVRLRYAAGHAVRGAM
ncbi:MAG: UTRA domain-containing protein [Pseudomonadota bacterium]